MLFYLPPDEFWYLTVARISVEFDDNKSGTGTAFFIFDKEHYYLVTARHVVDPRYLPYGKKRDANCSQLKISFQCAINPGTENATSGYQRLSVGDPHFCMADNDVDVVALKIPKHVLPIENDKQVIRPFSFSVDYLATDENLEVRYAGEPVVFIGYPGNSPVHETDGKEFHYPLLRQGVFAYPPVHGIEVEGQLGRNYGLLDSYAQSGFSGGPIISLQKGWADGSWHPEEHHRPPKVVGLICGHYRSAQDDPDGRHAGLSFFARSNSILDAINRAKNTAD
ncbi:trypsin-like peptidase domain-containing protein [Litoreibacter albidus]|uniref:trypsin-like peptidase domain-containing protein n=1 Tax=Litoreibacter albidus TaxID=670155 RepID=UPI00373570BF